MRRRCRRSCMRSSATARSSGAACRRRRWFFCCRSSFLPSWCAITCCAASHSAQYDGKSEDFMAEIRINRMTKRFGDVVALHELDMHVRDGEFLVLLGPSGCGKTTTLRSVAGLERQSSGDIYIGDTLVNNLPPGDRDIAMVFQFYALYPHLSAYDNIAFPLRAQRVLAAEVDTRVRAVARVLRIEHLLKRRPKQLSGGEQQRVALGRAMVRRPRVFLMDEPLTNLDAALRADMRAELKHLQHDLGTTMVYVTHDQTEAMSMGQRIAVMNRGLIQQIGTPLEDRKSVV